MESEIGVESEVVISRGQCTCGGVEGGRRARGEWLACVRGVLTTSFRLGLFSLFFFNDTATTEIYTLSLHDALPIFI